MRSLITRATVVVGGLLTTTFIALPAAHADITLDGQRCLSTDNTTHIEVLGKFIHYYCDHSRGVWKRINY